MKMGKDFSFTIYRDLIAEIKKTEFKVLTLKDYFQQKHHPPAFFIIRHDVDRRPEHALKMALVESSYGIQSTYYFRVNKRVFKREIIQKIAELGHEIGYHYEVVDKAHGDMDLAGRIFDVDLAKLRALADISTAAMHGNPLTSWDNKDFWQHFLPLTILIYLARPISAFIIQIFFILQIPGGAGIDTGTI